MTLRNLIVHSYVTWVTADKGQSMYYVVAESFVKTKLLAALADAFEWTYGDLIQAGLQRTQ